MLKECVTTEKCEARVCTLDHFKKNPSSGNDTDEPQRGARNSDDPVQQKREQPDLAGDCVTTNPVKPPRRGPPVHQPSTRTTLLVEGAPSGPSPYRTTNLWWRSTAHETTLINLFARHLAESLELQRQLAGLARKSLNATVPCNNHAMSTRSSRSTGFSNVCLELGRQHVRSIQWATDTNRATRPIG